MLRLSEHERRSRSRSISPTASPRTSSLRCPGRAGCSSSHAIPPSPTKASRWTFARSDVSLASATCWKAACGNPETRPHHRAVVMNIEVRAKERTQQDQARHRRLRLPSQAHASSRCSRSSAISGGAISQTYGNRSRHGYAKGYAYPKMTPQAARRDAWPPGGGLPASDLDFVPAAASRFLRHQRGDHESAVADRAGRHERRAVGRDGDAPRTRRSSPTGPRREPRLKSSVVVPYEDGVASAAEVRKRAGNKEFAQVFMLSRIGEARGPQALLADLRGRGRGRPAGRHPRLRLLAAGR